MRRIRMQLGPLASRRRVAWGQGVALLALFCAGSAFGQALVHASPDKTIPFGGSGDWLADHEVGALSPGLGATWVDLGPLVDEVAVSGFTMEGADALFVVDRPTDLGGLVAWPRDVVRYDGNGYSLAFDGASAGLGDAASIDGLSKDGRDYLLSFETSQLLPGGLLAKDHDVVRFSATGFSLEFDGTTAGVDDAWDVDAIDFEHVGRLNLSFDTSGVIGGVAFADEDLLTFNGTVWTLAWSGAGEDPAWTTADLDAVFVPEPSFGVALLLGTIALGRLAAANSLFEDRAGRISGRRRRRRAPAP